MAKKMVKDSPDIITFKEVEAAGPIALDDVWLKRLNPMKMEYCCGGGFVNAAALQLYLGEVETKKGKRDRLIRVLRHVMFNLPQGRRTAVFVTTTRGGPQNYEALNEYLRDLGYKRAVWMSRHGDYPIFMWCLCKKKYEGKLNVD